MTAADVEKAINEFVRVVELGQLTRELALLFAFKAQGDIQKILRILEANGAPTRPR